MIAFLKGILESKQDSGCLVDVNGVGYEVSMPNSDVERLPTPGEAVTVHTCLLHRDDGDQLFGFLKASDRRLFKLLLSVAKVGPKSALAVLSGLSQDQLETVVAQQDVAALALIPGIGRKTAERLLLELKDKLKTVVTVSAVLRGPDQESFAETLEALAALGYSRSQARLAMQKVVDEALPAQKTGQDRVAEIVRQALRYL